LEALATAKRLPSQFLRDLGVMDLPTGGVGIPYYGVTGEEVFVRERGSPRCGNRRFHQPIGVPLAPYGQWCLDQAANASFLIFVEGESDCWTCWYHGLPALGLPGANAAKALEHDHVAAVETVYVHREPDQGGTSFVKDIVKRLAAIGYRGKVFELRMPDGIKDPADLHVQDPSRFLGRLRQAIQASTLMAQPQSPDRNSKPEKKNSEPVGLVTTCLATIQAVPVRWLVPGYLPLGKLVLLAGDGGHGKSTLTLDLAACLTTGRSCFGLPYEPLAPGDVLLISCEDDYGDTVVPRLLSAGADLNRIHKVDGILTSDGKTAPFSLAHFQAIEEELAARPDVRLIVIDPAGAYIGRSGVDDYNDSELRSLLGPLAELAARHSVIILLVKHLVKGATARAVHKVGGSAGYVNTVRAAFVVAPDAEEPERKLFLPLKFNLGPRPQGLAYRMRSLDVPVQQDLLETYGAHLDWEDRERLSKQLFRIEWLGPVNEDADWVLGDQARRDLPSAKDLDVAADWLSTFLQVRPRESRKCVAEGNAALKLAKSLDWWRDAVLKSRLTGKARKTGFGDGQRWWFTLPGHSWPFPGLEEPSRGKGRRHCPGDWPHLGCQRCRTGDR
jgi:hypothetical protein